MTNRIASIALIILMTVFAAFAQSTEFIYQGQLQNSSALAGGSYDFEFLLYDAVSGGNQVGATLTKTSVAVANGIFSVPLDFGANYPGAGRFLEIHVRQAGGGAFTPLSPRQSISSTPYSVKSTTSDNASNAVNAAQLGGVAASGYLQTNGNGSGLTNLNATNITGGTLSNARLGQVPTGNIADSAVTATKIAGGQVVKGVTVGATTLTDNVTLAAGSNVTVTPVGNTVTIASTASGVGGSGTANSIPLFTAGTTLGNSLITQSGGNVGIGTTAPIDRFTVQTATSNFGITHTDGVASVGTYVGSGSAGYGGWFGTRSNHPLFFYTNGGSAQMTIDQLGAVGINAAPSLAIGRLYVAGGPFDGIYGTSSAFANGAGVRGSSPTGFGVYGSGGIGVYGSGGSYGLYSEGKLHVTSTPFGSGNNLCISGGDIMTCGSSLRFKTNVHPFLGGLDVIRRLQPINFDWKDGSGHDVGLGAEDVARVAPSFAITDNKGDISGVKYDKLSALFINAFKEQQAQIERQRQQIDNLQNQVEQMKQFLCRRHSKTKLCR